MQWKQQICADRCVLYLDYGEGNTKPYMINLNRSKYTHTHTHTHTHMSASKKQNEKYESDR